MQGAVVGGVDASMRPWHAPWSRRVIAALLDDAILGAVAFMSVGGDKGAGLSLTPVLSGDGTTSGPWVMLVFAVMIGMQAYTGSSPAKVLMGIAVLDDRNGRPLGLWRTLLRWLAHLLDAILLIGYLRPLWDAERRTFADAIVGSDAIVVPRTGWRRSFLPVALAACVVGAVLGLVTGSANTASTTTCDLVPTGEGTATVTYGSAAWAPPTETVTRFWISRQVRVEGGGQLIVSWQTDDMVIDASDGAIRVDVVDDAGQHHDASTPTVQASTTLTLGDAMPRDLTMEQVIDGAVVAHCEAPLP